MKIAKDLASKESEFLFRAPSAKVAFIVEIVMIRNWGYLKSIMKCLGILISLALDHKGQV